MITKKEFLIFSLSIIGLIVFGLSGGETTKQNSISFDTKEDSLLVGKIKFRTAQAALSQKKRILKNSKDMRIFKTRLANNNLSKTIKKAKSLALKNSSKKVVPKVVKKKKKKDDKKEKKVAKKNKLNPIKPLVPSSNKKIASAKSNLESIDMSSMSHTQNIDSRNRQQASQEDETAVETVVLEDEKTAQDSVASLGNNETNAITGKSIYTELLENDRLAEFEELINSELSETQRIQSFQDAISFLLSKDLEHTIAYENFIRTQFFNDKYAVIISKSLNDPKMTLEQVQYSVSSLNHMVLTWTSQLGGAAFKQIYQDNVMGILSQNEERRDLFTGLQSSIEAKSILLADKSIEVSAN